MKLSDLEKKVIRTSDSACYPLLNNSYPHSTRQMISFQVSPLLVVVVFTVLSDTGTLWIMTCFFLAEISSL